MGTRDEKWKASTEDMKFLAELNKDLGKLDFYYQYSSDNYVYCNNEAYMWSILDRIKGIENKDLQDVAVILYDLYVSKHGGELGIDWDSFLED